PTSPSLQLHRKWSMHAVTGRPAVRRARSRSLSRRASRRPPTRAGRAGIPAIPRRSALARRTPPALRPASPRAGARHRGGSSGSCFPRTRGRMVGGMEYPLTVSDFLYRAELVYGERVGVVDEPDQPAPSLGDLTYARMARLAQEQAARLGQLGVPGGGRGAVVSHN